MPGTKGREKAPAVILQGHVDMVAEKDKSTDFDFLKDPIAVVVEGDWVIAPKTTLGADNGIGVAAAQAVADDTAVAHGPLELLFTVDEETGLTGAMNVEGSLFTGRTLLNLDSEEDGTLFVGCAGGCTTDLVFDLSPSASPPGWTELAINVTGLKGGHSGLAIHENRGNAIKVLAELIARTLARGPLRLVRIEGGNKHNAIPREANAVIAVPAGSAASLRSWRRPSSVTRCRKSAASIRTCASRSVRSKGATQAPPRPRPAPGAPVASLAARRAGHEPRHPRPGRDLDESRRGRDRRRPGRDQQLQPFLGGPGVAQGPRADSAPSESLAAPASRAHAYPGWQPNMASPLLALCRSTWKQLHGTEAHVTAVHAGLECGLINERLGGGVDMISFGPWLEGVHAPGEKVNWKTVQRFFAFLSAILERLSS